MAGLVSLEQQDLEVFNLIEEEKNRQWKSLELIASENFTSRAVMDCLGSALTNKYSEGLPNARYYGGNEVIDRIEILCQQRALQAFHVDSEHWGVNVQPYSGSPANFAVYTALLRPHDRIMGLDLPSGGHLTHGFYTYSKAENTRKPVSATSIFFESLPYRVSATTGLIDFDALAEQAALFKPALIVCGGSAYPRDWDYKRFREIADANGSLLMCDMAHYSGLVATGEHNNPFEYCDIVTTTTHKSLRGPRAGMIFFRKDARNFEARINQAVFPGLQGGPHDHQVAAIATQLLEVQSDAYHQYTRQVKANAKTLAQTLMDKGYTMCTGGTDNHLMLWDLRPQKLTGSKLEKLCDLVCITLNKNSVLGDRSAMSPGGVRIGACALTSRGFKEAEFLKIADFLDRAVKLCLEIQATSGKKLVDFVKAAETNEGVKALRHDVNVLATSFAMPGFDVTTMRNKTI